MKSFLVIGLGLFGRHVCMQLSEMGHDVMAVDYKEDRINDILPYVTNAQIGDSKDVDFLRSLGIDNYDDCIVTIGSDFESSIVTTSLLHELGAQHIVARAEKDMHAKLLKNNGADDVVYPEQQMAKWTAIRYSSDHIFDFIELDDNFCIMELCVPDQWLGHSIGNLKVRNKYNITILGIKNNDVLNMDITNETVFSSGQHILALGSLKQLQKCFHI